MNKPKNLQSELKRKNISQELVTSLLSIQPHDFEVILKGSKRLHPYHEELLSSRIKNFRQ